MNRPKLDKPRVQEWHNDDAQLSELLDHIDKKVLNINAWEFYNESENKYVDFNTVLEKVQVRYPTHEWITVMKDSYVELPKNLNRIKKDLFVVMKRFTLNLQERLNYIEQMEEYLDSLEQSIEEKDRLIEGLQEKEGNRDVNNKIDKLHEAISEIKNAIYVRPERSVTTKNVRTIPELGEKSVSILEDEKKDEVEESPKSRFDKDLQ